MDSWESLSRVERTLMRCAVRRSGLAGTIEEYGTALRWEGAPDAPPPRSMTVAERSALVPEFAAAARAPVERGLLVVDVPPERWTGQEGPALEGAELAAALADPARWVWSREEGRRRLGLRVDRAVGDRYARDVLPAHPEGAPGLSALDELTEEEDEILLCASELSGWLTGPWGIWEEPPAELDPAGRLAFVERRIAPLLPWVRAGWIEVRHFLEPDGEESTVIPHDRLAEALTDPAIRYQGEEWGVGVTCVYTYAGLAARRRATG